ncbi:hypothetical protein CES85_1343 [Ochrobactrum quorumnocens]|uniref:Uncharacterized protein n=1 Tax=Ochrobactrum quorumnocens TaxID=271865 RepID=A0A248UHD8_9HYPH|nr:hypothetical protein CES85_1343 [[Ochrobactrum] quorumnocens]
MDLISLTPAIIHPWTFSALHEKHLSTRRIDYLFTTRKVATMSGTFMPPGFDCPIMESP